MRFMHDTTPEAERVYYEMLAAKSFADRALLTQALSRRIRQISQAGIRAQNPAYSDEEVNREYLRRIMTRDEFKVLFPPS